MTVPQSFCDAKQHVSYTDPETVRCLYTSVGVNPRSGCCDVVAVGSNNSYSYSFLAFAASHNICLTLLCESENEALSDMNFHVCRMLSGHSTPVLCLRWIRPDARDTSSDFVVLASADHCGKVIVWGCKRDRLLLDHSIVCEGDWFCFTTLNLPDGAIPSALDGFLWLDPLGTSSSCMVLDVAADSAFYSWYIEPLQTEKTTDDSVVCRFLCDSVPPTVTYLGRSLALCLRSFAWSASSSTLFHFILIGLDTGLIELWSEALNVSDKALPSLPSERPTFTRSASLVGHTDWVRCLDVHRDVSSSNFCIFIASGGQDSVIRLWRTYQVDQIKANVHAKVCDIRLPPTPTALDPELSVASESVLSGHDNWITGLHWAPSSVASPPALLSSSMDKSLLVWSPPQSESGGLWIECSRLGNMGGTDLGFLDCLWSPSEKHILGLSFQGNLSVWNRLPEDSFWSPSWPICGHHGPVADISWCPPGDNPSDQVEKSLGLPFRLLLTAGTDQTVRAHAPRLLPFASNRDQSPQGHNFTWHELARTQIHGYDMNAVTGLSSISYVSAGDEKVARVFKATRAFVDAYLRATGTSCYPLGASDASEMSSQSLPEGAAQPTLGLSNQASTPVVSQDKGNVEVDLALSNGYEGVLHCSASDVPVATEDRLQHQTLWPETKKLYGHPYEVFCLAAHPSIPLVASACLASKPAHAYIILWNGSSDWSIHQRLFHHQLTVTQLSWSHNGAYLLALSRDRTWSVWSASQSRDGDGDSVSDPPIYELTACPLKGHSHSRIIWTGAWTPDDWCFLTGSRDRSIYVWLTPSRMSQTTLRMCKPLDATTVFSHAVTALDVCSFRCNEPPSACVAYLTAVGLESGDLLLATLTRLPRSAAAVHGEYELVWSNFLLIPPDWSHVPNKQVRRVAFEPAGHKLKASPRFICLATGADDGVVHVFEIDRTKFSAHHNVTSQTISPSDIPDVK